MKQQLRYLLANEEYGAIVELAGRKKRILSFLTALTYDPEPLIGWRAVEAIGLAAARIAGDNPEFVRIHLRRLLWLLNDESGGIGWRFPEAMGEIIRNRPQQFAEFVPLVISLFDMAAEDAVRFKPGILWAIGRLGQVMPAAVKTAKPKIIPCLDDLDPQTRGLAVWCLGQLGDVKRLSHHKALSKDESLVELYSHGQLTCKSVAQLVHEALESKPSNNKF